MQKMTKHWPLMAKPCATPLMKRTTNSDYECRWTLRRDFLCPKKVGALPVSNGSDEVKQSNEIKFAPILLDLLPIHNKDITGDAINTQTAFARYLVEQRKAHYYLSVKANQPTLLEDIKVHFLTTGKKAAKYRW